MQIPISHTPEQFQSHSQQIWNKEKKQTNKQKTTLRQKCS